MMKELSDIQARLRAPKDQRNDFAKYRFRKLESIYAAVKPLVREAECALAVEDELVEMGGGIYVRAVATLTNAAGETARGVAYAREERDKKGQDAAQMTGSASTYARKYALGGLFLIDDAGYADPDAPGAQIRAKAGRGAMDRLKGLCAEAATAATRAQLEEIWRKGAEFRENPLFVQALTDRSNEIQKK